MSDQTESHSALFGLNPQSKPTQNAGSGPGSDIEGTTGVKGQKNSVASSAAIPDTNTKVGGVAQPGTDHERPGAGGSMLTPSQGTNKAADS